MGLQRNSQLQVFLNINLSSGKKLGQLQFLRIQSVLWKSRHSDCGDSMATDTVFRVIDQKTIESPMVRSSSPSCKTHSSSQAAETKIGTMHHIDEKLSSGLVSQKQSTLV